MDNYDSITFDSIYAMGAHVRDSRAHDDDRKHGKSSTHGKSSAAFYGNMSLNESTEIALNGGAWADGLPTLPRVHLPNTNIHGNTIDQPQINSDIVGFAPNVGAYVSGAPDSMLYMMPEPVSDKHIKIAVNIRYSSVVDTNQIANRGAAIIAVLDQLTLDGYAVELWAVYSARDLGVGVIISTCIKTSDAPLSPEAIAYALCSPSYSRRLCFRVSESIRGSNNAAIISGSNYGYAGELDASLYHVTFDQVCVDNCKSFNTITGAVEYVQTDVKTQLNLEEAV